MLQVGLVIMHDDGHDDNHDDDHEDDDDANV